MRTFEYYVYTQGAALQKALNAIATFFDSASFASMTSISLMIGAVMTMAYFFTTRNPRHLVMWMVVFTLVPSLLLQQKARMQIIDNTSITRVYAVDNVPYIVALPTWFFSTMMMGIAESVESIFTTVDDERYTRTGMLFGSEIFMLSRQTNLTSVKTRRQWNDFFYSCIIGDIEINKKYTWDELFSAPDIFEFLDGQSMSPLRGVMLDGLTQDFKTCREFYPTLKNDFDDASADQLDLISLYLYNDKSDIYKTHVRQALQNSYQSMISVSNNAVQALRQNMAMNAIRFSIDTLDPDANGMNYAYTSNKMQQTSMWATLGLQAREFIPMLHSMLFFMFSCLGFFVAAAALIPSLTKIVLSNYIKTFAYLSVWPALFAILNGIMLWSLEAASIANANPLHGLSLYNANALTELHTRFGYMTGFLMMTIPVLAGKILQGGVAVAQAMNYQLAGMINSTNARVSAASSTGNIDFGNLQMQNHNYNNTSANKFDDNLLLRSGMSTVQNPDGSYVTTQHNNRGAKLYNAQEAESKPLWQAQVSRMLQNSVSDQYAKTLTAQRQNLNNLSDAYSTGFAISDRWNDNWSKNKSYGDSYNLSTEGQIVRSQSKMDSAIANISQLTGWSKDKARMYASSFNRGIDASANGDFLKSVIKFSGQLGYKWTSEDRDSYNSMSAEQKQALAQSTEQYNDAATSITRAGQTIDAKENKSEIEQYAHDFSVNFNRTRTASAAVTESNTKMQNLSNMQSRLENDSVNFGQSAITGFQRYLQKSYADRPIKVEQLMNATSPDAMRAVRLAFNDYTRTEQFQTDFGVDTRRNRYQDFADMYKPQNLSRTPDLDEEQINAVNTGAERAQNKREEVVMGLAAYKGSDLFDQGEFNNIAGNAKVIAGAIQNDAEKPNDAKPLDLKLQKVVEKEQESNKLNFFRDRDG